MRPTGKRRALMRAGAIGERGSTAIATLGSRWDEAAGMAIFYRRNKVVVAGRCIMSRILVR
jgi:hypothetical protein